HK
ncbi:putative acyltransferase yihG, partial [Vibrio harveyi]